MAPQISTFVLVSIFAVVTVYGTAPITNEVETSGLSIDSKNGVHSKSTADRLQNEVTAVLYTLTIQLGNDFVATGEFTGKLSLEVTSTIDTKKDIAIHSVDLTYTKKFSLVADGATPTELLDPALQAPGVPEQTVVLKFATGKTMIKDTKHILAAEFTGKLQKDMRGLYLNKYKNKDDEDEFAVATQLQPTHARKLFPCFDEPKYKSKFEVTLIYPKEYKALFNTPADGALEKEGELLSQKFKTTPTMSTYLLGIVISKFRSIGELGEGNTLHSVWSRMDVLDSLYGLRKSPELLTVMEEYTNNKFTTQDIGKVDHVALTDFSAGAMENWGLVTYREALFLYNDRESSKKDKQRICSIIAHELSHFWFGNLVTTDWWDNTWLNEGFARYFEYMAAHAVEPDMEYDKQFVVQQHLAIMNADSLPSSKALNSAANNHKEVADKFSPITYNKGAAIIRMISWLTPEQFKTNLAKYIENNKGKTVTPDKLWEAMEAGTTFPTGITLKAVMDTYVTNPGLPLLQVKLDQNVVKIQQEKRFGFGLETGDDKAYFVPITYTTNKGGKELNFDETTPKCWIKADKQPLNCPEERFTTEQEVIFVNIKASAYARVNYDDVLWNRIKAILISEEFGGVDVITRAQIVDDALNLARAGTIGYQRAFDILEYLERENSYYPWYTALNGLQYLLRRLPPNDAAPLKEYILLIMQSINNNRLDETDHIKTLKSALAKSWKCELGDQECIQEMEGLFNNMRADQSIDPDLRSTAYCVGIRRNDANVWNDLFERHTTTSLPSEARLILTALGCSTDDDVRNAYLMRLIDEEGEIRDQDAEQVFSSVLAGNTDGADIAAQFVIDNHVALDDRFKDKDILKDMVKNLIDRFTSLVQTEHFRTALQAIPGTGPSFKADALTLLTAADKNIEWIEAQKANINTPVTAYLNRKRPVAPNPPGGNTTPKPKESSVGSIAASILLVAFNVYLVYFIRQ